MVKILKAKRNRQGDLEDERKNQRTRSSLSNQKGNTKRISEVLEETGREQSVKIERIKSQDQKEKLNDIALLENRKDKKREMEEILYLEVATAPTKEEEQHEGQEIIREEVAEETVVEMAHKEEGIMKETEEKQTIVEDKKPTHQKIAFISFYKHD